MEPAGQCDDREDGPSSSALRVVIVAGAEGGAFRRHDPVVADGCQRIGVNGKFVWCTGNDKRRRDQSARRAPLPGSARRRNVRTRHKSPLKPEENQVAARNLSASVSTVFMWRPEQIVDFIEHS